jgi:hypothetical protein
VDVAGSYGPGSDPNIVIARSSSANVLCICSLEEVCHASGTNGQGFPKAEAHLDRIGGKRCAPTYLSKQG